MGSLGALRKRSSQGIAGLVTLSMLLSTVAATARPAMAELKAPPKGTAKVVPEKPEDLKAIEGLTLDTDLDVQPGQELEPEPKPEAEEEKAEEKKDEKSEEKSDAKKDEKADAKADSKDKKEEKKSDKKSDKPAEKKDDKPDEEAKPTSSLDRKVVPGSQHLPFGPILSDAVSYQLSQTTSPDEKKDVPTDPVVFLEGSYTDTKRRLFIGFDPVRITRDKRFKIAIPINQAETTIELISRPKSGAGGDVVARYVIKFRDWKKFSGDPKVRNASANQVIVGGSFGSFNYDEEGEDPAKQIALSLYAIYQRELRPRLVVKGSAAFTLLPIGGKPEGFRFLKLTAGAAYEVWRKDAWDLNVGFALRYLRMIVPSDAFGFSNVFGYQITPQIQRRLPSGNLVSGYLLIGPASLYNGVIPGGGNMEFGVGATYYLVKEGKRPIGISLEFATMSVDIDSRAVSSNQILLGGSYSLF